MRLWLLVPLAAVVLVLADLSAPRFDPVFDAIPAALGMTTLVMAVLAVLVGVFFATYSLPAEIDSRVAYTVTTKPVGRGELVAGKVLGLALTLLAMLAVLAVASYAYMLVRASSVRTAARVRLAEAGKRTRFKTDLNALQGVIRSGPMQAYRYLDPAEGPDVRIHYAEGQAPESDVQWTLAGTSTVLTWDAQKMPVKDLLGSAPGELRVGLRLRPPAGAAPKPATVVVAIVPHPRTGQPPPDVKRPRGHLIQQRELSETGILAIPLYPDTMDVPDGALQLPGSDPFHVEAWLISKRNELSGYLLGARGRSLEFVGPTGQRLLLEEPPDTSPQAIRQKYWIAGRADLPRQVATFRFGDVPAEALGRGDTAVEIAGSLDAMSAATVEATAQVVFINLRTLGRQGPILYTPELNRPSLLYIDRAIWHGGPLEVQIECSTDEDLLGLEPASVRLRPDAGPYAWHVATATLCVWFFGTVLAAAGVTASARLSWFVAIVPTIAFFLLATTRSFVFTIMPLRYSAVDLTRRLSVLGAGVDWYEVAKHIVLPLPDLAAMLPPDSMNYGQALPLEDLGLRFVWAAVSVLAMVVIGWLLYRRREIAA